MRNSRAKQSTSLVAVMILLGACTSSKKTTSAGDTATKTSGPVVSLKLLQFAPSTLTVKAGTTVSWREDEQITHTVTSGKVIGVDPTTTLRADQKPDGRFDHTLSNTGDTFTYTFTTPGTYSYFCSIHKGMNGSVTVTP